MTERHACDSFCSGRVRNVSHVRIQTISTYVLTFAMVLTASKLRENIYRLLDHALETGEVIEIERNGRKLRIVPDGSRTRLDRLVPRPETVVGDSESLVHADWSGEWKP